MLSSAVLICTQKELVRTLVRSNSNHFYVYVLKRPDGTPFYVGKGKNDRVFNHESAAVNTTVKSYKLNIIKAIKKNGRKITYEIDSFHVSESDAHERERQLIQNIGRHDLGTGPLANLTDGGEGTSNPSEESKQKHRDTLSGITGDDDRSIANRFFIKLMAVESVPIKPADKFRPEPLSPMNKPLTKFTSRMAAALAASAIANRVMLEDGCVIPRQLLIEGKKYLIENGVGKDILKVKMAELISAPNPKNEAFRVSQKAIDFICQTIDNHLLLDSGVLMPTG